MGHLVGIDVVQVFQGGAGMIDLVKIGGVHIGGFGGPLHGFVKEGGSPLVHIDRGERGVPIPKHQLTQPQSFAAVDIRRGDAEQPAGDGAHGRLFSLFRGIQVLHLPFQQGVIGLFQLQAGPVHPVGRILQGVGAGADDGKERDLAHIHHLTVGKADGGVLVKDGIALGGVGVAQLEKGADGVNHRHQQHRQHVFFLKGVPLEGEGHLPGLCLRHGDPLQRVLPGGRHLPEIDEKGNGCRQGRDSPDAGRLHIAEKPAHAVDNRIPGVGQGLPQRGGGRGRLLAGTGGQRRAGKNVRKLHNDLHKTG